MNFERFTEKAQAAVAAAQETAVRMGHQQIDGEHIHLALCTQQDGLIPRLLGYMGHDVNRYAKDVETELDKFPRIHGSGASAVYASRRFNELLIQAQDEAKRFKDEYTGVEHIYIALLRERNTPSQTVFSRFNITLDSFMEALGKVRIVNPAQLSSETRALYTQLKKAANQ